MKREAEPEIAQLPTVGGGDRQVELILWEMAQSRHMQDSAVLASIVEQQLRARVPMSARAIQQAPFRVLVGANMPAVLVEVGFLTNPGEETKLGSAEHQGQIVQALFESIVRFRTYIEGGRRSPAASPGSPGLARRTALMGRVGVIVMAGIATALLAGWFLVVKVPNWFAPKQAQPALTTPAADTAVRKIRARLFYVSEDGMQLVGVERDVPFGDTPTEQATALMEEQLKPAPEPLLSAMPAGTSLRAVYVTEGGDAYVDLSKEVTAAHTGGSLDELFSVYAVVNAMTVNLPAIVRVQILVDGREVDSLAGHIDLRGPLPRSDRWATAPASASPASPTSPPSPAVPTPTSTPAQPQPPAPAAQAAPRP